MQKLSLILAASLLAGAAHAAMPPGDFVKKAGASDLFEVTSAKLETSSSNPKIRAFAQMMIKDHTASTAQVKAAAIKSGLKPKPPMLDPKQTADIAALKRVSGTARDTLYIAQQKAAHQEALALHKDNAEGSAAPALKAASAKIVPVVEHHIQELSTM
jgi:putative membrane protein